MTTDDMQYEERLKEILQNMLAESDSFRTEVRMLKDHIKEIAILQKATREHFIFNGSFQEAIAPVTSQIFSLMPVVGIKSKHAEDVYFSWWSLRTIYSLVVFVGLVFNTCLTTYWVFSQTLVFSNIVPLIFNGSCVVVFIFFLMLAQKWPLLMLKWQEVEKILPPHKCQWEKAELAHKIKITSIVVLTMSLIEHLLSIISVVHHANYCNSNRDPLKDFFMATLSQLFYITTYSPAKAVSGKMLNVLQTFIWNYMDLFVMLMSLGLATRFKQVNNSLMAVKGKPMPEFFWAEHRQYYRKLCNLCVDVDRAISKITILSFSNNLYFICVQLLNSLNKMPSFAHTVYFWFSLSFLIGRTLAVSLFSADINDQSKVPLKVLRAVPRESWCTETKRFSEEVNNDVVALSGMNFFYLTRNLVLSVAGTIVTYELVLIQFHEDEKVVIKC